MALTPTSFIQKVSEKEPNTLEGMVATSLVPWTEEYGEEGFDRFVESLRDEIYAVHALHAQFLREQKTEG